MLVSGIEHHHVELFIMLVTTALALGHGIENRARPPGEVRRKAVQGRQASEKLDNKPAGGMEGPQRSVSEALAGNPALAQLRPPEYPLSIATHENGKRAGAEIPGTNRAAIRTF